MDKYVHAYEIWTSITYVLNMDKYVATNLKWICTYIPYMDKCVPICKEYIDAYNKYIHTYHIWINTYQFEMNMYVFAANIYHMAPNFCGRKFLYKPFIVKKLNFWDKFSWISINFMKIQRDMSLNIGKHQTVWWVLCSTCKYRASYVANYLHGRSN